MWLYSHISVFNVVIEYYMNTGWWLGHEFDFSIQLGRITIPIDKLIFFRGVGIPTSWTETGSESKPWCPGILQLADGCLFPEK